MQVQKPKQIKGALPEGFFDNKEADLLARGIKPVKPDVKDEYKEYEKLIQEDLKLVDDYLEEEEIDAAEMIEEYESVDQKQHKRAQNARHAAMRLVAQPQLTRTNLHEILRNPERKWINSKIVSLRLTVHDIPGQRKAEVVLRLLAKNLQKKSYPVMMIVEIFAVDWRAQHP
uniref:Uncharacterized protein n=1 Tax=Poncirus trifoliata TaxID=37690 RepID=Q8H6R8_PONTR|nr:hypothetical protein [Citrus trifoliata]